MEVLPIPRCVHFAWQRENPRAQNGLGWKGAETPPWQGHLPRPQGAPSPSSLAWNIPGILGQPQLGCWFQPVLNSQLQLLCTTDLAPPCSLPAAQQLWLFCGFLLKILGTGPVFPRIPVKPPSSCSILIVLQPALNPVSACRVALVSL